MKIIDGKKISEDILVEIKMEVKKLPFTPVFCDVLVGGDPVSKQYVNLKAKKASQAGMSFYDAAFPENITTEELVEEIQNINKIKNMCGVIVQLPLPVTIDTNTVLNAIDPRLDVDCLGIEMSDAFYNNKSILGPPTAMACMYLLKTACTELKDKKVVVLGRGELVGRPVSALLRFAGIEHSTLDNQSNDKEEILRDADVVISGIGKGNYIKGEMIKPGAIIIDAGASESGSGIVGDVDRESVKDVASYLSPVPGGVGPVTVAMLFKNVLEVARRKSNEQ